MEKYELISEDWELNPENVDNLISLLKSESDGEWKYKNFEAELGGGWVFNLEERFGGSEGSGEIHWIVFSLSKDGQKTFWQIDGYYASYDGAYLDGDAYEVESAEQVVTIWKKK